MPSSTSSGDYILIVTPSLTGPAPGLHFSLTNPTPSRPPLAYPFYPTVLSLRSISYIVAACAPPVMFTYRGHTRHLSWPTSIQLLPGSMTKPTRPRTALKQRTTYTQTLPRIAEDEDPFSHFLSPVLEEEDAFDDLSYSAGITPFDREPISKQDALFRARLEEKWETYVARRLLKHSKNQKGKSTSIPAPLPPPFPQTPSTPPEEDSLPELLEEPFDSDMVGSPSDSIGPSSPDRMAWTFPSMSSPEPMDWTFPSSDSPLDVFDARDGDADMEVLDGWAVDLCRVKSNAKLVQIVSPTPKRPRLNSFRTLSGKRRSWREPSPELYTLDEEAEVDGEEEGRGRGRKGRRTAKSVRWNEEVQVLEFER